MSDAAPPVAAAPPPPVETRPRPSPRKTQLVALGIGLVGMIVFPGVAYLAHQKMNKLIREQAEAERTENAAFANIERDAREVPLAVAKNPSTLPPAPQKEAPAPPAPVVNAPAASPPATPVATRSTAPAPAPTGSAEPNPAAQEWINKLKISGVRGGASPKILLQGKTFDVGDVIHADFGVAFAGYDPARDTVRFKDSNGAMYERGVR